MNESVRPELPLHIDSTMNNAFFSCPQKFKNEFILGLRPARLSVDLHAGAAFSSTLEHFYINIHENKVPVQAAIARAHGHFARAWGDFEIEKETPKTPNNMWAAIEDYIATYPPDTDKVQPLSWAGRTAVEFSFAIPLTDPTFPRHPSGDPFIYVGRADMLGQLVQSGRPCIRDEKTTARLPSNWSEQWDLRAQFLGYCWAAQQGGIDCDTVVVRGVVINKTSIRQVEAIKIYAGWEIARWYEQLRRNLTRLVQCWNEGYFDYALGEACTSYSGCPFVVLCKSPNPDTWYSTFKVLRWNPLLRNPIDQESGPYPISLAVNPVSTGSNDPNGSAIAMSQLG